MKKQIIAVIGIITITAILFVGCSPKNDDVDATVLSTDTTSAVAESESGSSTEKESTAENDSEKSSASNTNDEKHNSSTTAARPTTAAKQSATKAATKATTQATTKSTTRATTQATTTTQKASQCTNNNNHSVSCGNMGRWFNSKSEVRPYVDSVMKEWADKKNSGEITREEYIKNCPQGYECWSCGYCGKWTGNFTY